MNAEEARRIWDNEVSLKAQGFLEYIKKMILQYTYQQNAFLYTFEFPDFVNTVQGDEEQAISDEFIQAILEKIAAYFENLGFKVKVDKDKFRLWIRYLSGNELERDSFTEKLINIINHRRSYRASGGIEDYLSIIFSEIREKARRNRSIKFPLTLNIPNAKSILLEDLLEIVDRLEKKGYEVIIDGPLFNISSGDNREFIINNAVNEGLCFEKLEICLIIKW